MPSETAFGGSPSPSRPAVRYAPFLKTLFVAALLLVGWTYLFQLTAQGLADPRPDRWYLPAAVAVGLMPFISLFSAVASRKVYFGLCVVLLMMYLIFFPPSIFSAVAVTIWFYGFWRAFERTRFELDNHVKFSSSAILSRSIGVMMFVYIAVISVNVYGILERRISEDPEAFLDGVTHSITRSVLPLLERQIPEFDQNETIEEFLLKRYAAESQIQGETPSDEELDELQLQLESQLGVSHENGSGPTTLEELTRQAVSNKLTQWVEPLSAFLPALYSFAIFAVLRVFGVVMRYLAVGWGLLIFHILRATRFFRITTTQITAEKLEI